MFRLIAWIVTAIVVLALATVCQAEEPSRPPTSAGLEAIAVTEKDRAAELVLQLAGNNLAARVSAADELGRLKTVDAIEPLIKVLYDYRSFDQPHLTADKQWVKGWRRSHDWVGAHAAKALSLITGRPLLTDPAKWHSWWDGHREVLRDPEAAGRFFADERAQRLDAVRERWKLELLPDGVPEFGPALIGTAWLEQGHGQDILGRGTARTIRFPFPMQQLGDQTAIVISTVRSHGAGSPLITTETTLTYGLKLEGPFFVYDELLHTGFLTADGKFIPDALVRVDDRKWYIAWARKLDETKRGPDNIELTEYLFDFRDDPMQQTRGTSGKLALQRQVRKLSNPKGQLIEHESRFHLLEAGEKGSHYEMQIGVPEGRSLTAYFPAGQDYGLLETHHPHGMGVYISHPRLEGSN